MHIEIIDNPFAIDVYGFSGTAGNKEYAQKAFQLSDKTWELVKREQLNHKGKNIWIYEPNDLVFAGVELHETPPDDSGLEHKKITIARHAYYKHVGPYRFIKQSGLAMQNELKEKGLEHVLPYIEIYGHWTADETKLETELLMCLK